MRRVRSLEISVVPESGAPLLLAVGAALLLGRHRAIARTHAPLRLTPGADPGRSED